MNLDKESLRWAVVTLQAGFNSLRNTPLFEREKLMRLAVKRLLPSTNQNTREVLQLLTTAKYPQLALAQIIRRHFPKGLTNGN